MSRSYLIELAIPNASLQAESHKLEIELTEDARASLPAGEVEIDYMSSCFSSPPLSKKMPVYAASPFKVLRLLAAYRLREHPFDERCYGLLRRRWSEEADAQVLEVLFESWISIQLQRLQVEANQVGSRRQRSKYVASAFTNLTNVMPERYAVPRLAAEAKLVALSYKQLFPEKFRHSK